MTAPHTRVSRALLTLSCPPIISDSEFEEAQRRWEKSLEDLLVEMLFVTDKDGKSLSVTGTRVIFEYRRCIDKLVFLRNPVVPKEKQYRMASPDIKYAGCVAMQLVDGDYWCRVAPHDEENFKITEIVAPIYDIP